MSWTDVSGVCGVVALLLGVYNTLRARAKELPKLRIVEDYRPGKLPNEPNPKYAIRLQNVGRIAVAIERVDLEFKNGTAVRSTKIWHRELGAEIIIAAGRGEPFDLPIEAGYLMQVQPNIEVVVRSEDGKFFRHRCTELGKFYADLKAISGHTRRA